MGAREYLQTAIAAAPNEMTVEAALRVADGYRARLERLQEQYRGLLLTLQPNITKAAVLDHVLSADDSTMVLCRATYNDRARRWSFAPLCSIEEARQVMEADLAAADEDEAECSVCLGTGEGAHEGTSCAACGGRGY